MTNRHNARRSCFQLTPQSEHLHGMRFKKLTGKTRTHRHTILLRIQTIKRPSHSTATLLTHQSRQPNQLIAYPIGFTSVLGYKVSGIKRVGNCALYKLNSVWFDVQYTLNIKPKEQTGQRKTNQSSNPTTRIHKHQMRHTILLKPCANSNPTFGSGSNRPSLWRECLWQYNYVKL